MNKDASPKPKTRDRILDGALRMFNEEGEPHVTTNAVADELDMSPGNLHYHFKTKSDLVEALIERFYNAVSELLEIESEEEMDIIEAWMRMQLLFELMWAHRFAYRDLPQLIAKYPSIRKDTARLLHRKISVAEEGCRIFGVPSERGEAEALARNIVVVMTYWISFELACGVEGEDRNRFGRGAYQVLNLLLPFLSEDDQRAIRNLASEYL